MGGACVVSLAGGNEIGGACVVSLVGGNGWSLQLYGS